MFLLHAGLRSSGIIAPRHSGELHNYLTLQKCPEGCPHRGGQMGKGLSLWREDFPGGGLLSYDGQKDNDMWLFSHLLFMKQG